MAEQRQRCDALVSDPSHVSTSGQLVDRVSEKKTAERKMASKAVLYLHTLWHLKPVQVYARIWRSLYRPALTSLVLPEPRMRSGTWTLPPERDPSLLGPATFRFLNETREIRTGLDWDNTSLKKLWLYNLHYFGDLNALNARARMAWHRALIARWIAENPPAVGSGWEPYPISLRAVNWIKWALAGGALDSLAHSSLAQQLQYLSRRIESHLLGNHLFSNGKALVFGGLFLEGPPADAWLGQGAEILAPELSEQVLPDGGHFERSPMYHALALEDVLDLCNMGSAYSDPMARHPALEQSCIEAARRMLQWLELMCHPDGQIAFFNDAAQGIALSAAALRKYAVALGLQVDEPARGHSVDLPESGYVRLEHGDWCAFFDAAPVGPDYQPGHAHADSLSFEVSVSGERLISNSGTSTYDSGKQRAFERSTRAHNTVELDGSDSSEVWASFRVARRARPFDRAVELLGDRSSVSCAHDGYRRLTGRPVHRRSLEVDRYGVRWTDRIEGAGPHRARGFIPLHPGVRAHTQGSGAALTTPKGRNYELRGEGITAFSVRNGTYGREFGLTEERAVLVWELEGPPPLEGSFTLGKIAD